MLELSLNADLLEALNKAATANNQTIYAFIRNTLKDAVKD